MLISPANTSQYITSGLKYYYSVINKRSCPNISGITSLIDLSGSGNTAGLASSSISTYNTIPCLTPYIYLNNSISISSPFSFEYFMYIIPGASNFILFMTDNSNQTVYIKINTDFSIILAINYSFVVYTSPPYSIICNSWNHIIITYDSSGYVNIYINNIYVVKNANQGYTTISFNCYIAGQSAGISDGNSYFGYTRYYNKALTSTEVNTNYYYVQTLYRNAFPNINSGGTFTNLAIGALSYNSVTFVPTYTGFSQASVSLAISLNQSGNPALSGYPINNIASGSSNVSSTLTQNTTYYGVLTSGSAIFSRLFSTYAQGTLTPTAATALSYNSATLTWTYTGYPSTTTLIITGNPSIGGTISTTVGASPQSLTSLSANTSYTITYTINSTTYGNTAPTSSFSTYAQGTLNSFNITAYSSSGILLTWTYGNGYSSGTSATITINNTSISQNVTLGQNSYQFPSSSLSSIMTNYGSVYTVKLSVNDTTYGNASISASSSIGGSYGFKIPNAYGSDSWYVGSLATSNDQGPYGNHSYYLVYLFTNVTSFPSLTFYIAVSGSYDYLLIGGGGGGGPTKGGGGGGGGVLQGTVNLVASGNPCSVSVGGGGGSATDGAPTVFDYSPAGTPVFSSPGVYGIGTVELVAESGGCGGSKVNNADNGASGGGAGANSSSVPGSGISSQGNSGGTGVLNGGGGGGGGYSGSGGNGSTIGGNGGTGYIDYMFLNGQSFSGGGGGFTIGFNSGGGLGVYGGGNGALGGTTVGPTNGTNGGGGGGGFNTGPGSTGGNGSAYFRQAYSF